MPSYCSGSTEDLLDDGSASAASGGGSGGGGGGGGHVAAEQEQQQQQRELDPVRMTEEIRLRDEATERIERTMEEVNSKYYLLYASWSSTDAAAVAIYPSLVLLVSKTWVRKYCCESECGSGGGCNRLSRRRCHGGCCGGGGGGCSGGGGGGSGAGVDGEGAVVVVVQLLLRLLLQKSLRSCLLCGDVSLLQMGRRWFWTLTL
jgi:hypothetical protein